MMGTDTVEVVMCLYGRPPSEPLSRIPLPSGNRVQNRLVAGACHECMHHVLGEWLSGAGHCPGRGGALTRGRISEYCRNTVTSVMAPQIVLLQAVTP